MQNEKEYTPSKTDISPARVGFGQDPLQNQPIDNTNMYPVDLDDNTNFGLNHKPKSIAREFFESINNNVTMNYALTLYSFVSIGFGLNYLIDKGFSTYLGLILSVQIVHILTLIYCCSARYNKRDPKILYENHQVRYFVQMSADLLLLLVYSLNIQQVDQKTAQGTAVTDALEVVKH